MDHWEDRTVKPRVTIVVLALVLPAAMQLTGCAAMAGAGIATGVAVANDERSPGAVIDDQLLEFEANDRIRGASEIFEASHINVTSFNAVILLTGETPSEDFKTRAAALVAAVPKVRSVHNELAIAAPSSLVARSSDSWLTTKVKTTLFSETALDATRVKVVTEKGVVYLMGLVSTAEAERATDLARRVTGVERVVRLFELTNT